MDTNFNLIKNLNEAFVPVKAGILSVSEVMQIKKALVLPRESALDMQNLRDIVVMYYSLLGEACNEKERALDKEAPQITGLEYSTRQKSIIQEERNLMDKMSGIVAVIDSCLVAAGVPV